MNDQSEKKAKSRARVSGSENHHDREPENCRVRDT